MSWSKEWFGDWFNSPYYHILYKNRDENEAKLFLNKLVEYFKISKEQRILDVACGKGRHAIYLNELGFDVVGTDLSEENIKEARRQENSRLKFFLHDMREIYSQNDFDYAFNMFTSFGYFEKESDNPAAIKAITSSLKKDGYFVLDFLNPYKVIHELVKEEVKIIEGVTFSINRTFDGLHIIKTIKFTDKGEAFQFQEKVKAIRQLEFLDYFRQANLQTIDTFGDYNLNVYSPSTSDRMIFICKKL